MKMSNELLYVLMEKNMLEMREMIKQIPGAIIPDKRGYLSEIQELAPCTERGFCEMYLRESSCIELSKEDKNQLTKIIENSFKSTDNGVKRYRKHSDVHKAPYNFPISAEDALEVAGFGDPTVLETVVDTASFMGWVTSQYLLNALKQSENKCGKPKLVKGLPDNSVLEFVTRVTNKLTPGGDISKEELAILREIARECSFSAKDGQVHYQIIYEQGK